MILLPVNAAQRETYRTKPKLEGKRRGLGWGLEVTSTISDVKQNLGWVVSGGGVIYATGCLRDKREEKEQEREREGGGNSKHEKVLNTFEGLFNIQWKKVEKEYFTADKCVCVSVCV